MSETSPTLYFQLLSYLAPLRHFTTSSALRSDGLGPSPRHGRSEAPHIRVPAKGNSLPRVWGCPPTTDTRPHLEVNEKQEGVYRSRELKGRRDKNGEESTTIFITDTCTMHRSNIHFCVTLCAIAGHENVTTEAKQQRHTVTAENDGHPAKRNNNVLVPLHLVLFLK